MEAYLNDRHLRRELRQDVGCPTLYAHVLLAERFGRWPWELRHEPADEVTRYLAVIGAEGQARDLLDGLSDTDSLVRSE
jgi:hypothetical protein